MLSEQELMRTHLDVVLQKMSRVEHFLAGMHLMAKAPEDTQVLDDVLHEVSGVQSAIHSLTYLVKN